MNAEDISKANWGAQKIGMTADLVGNGLSGIANEICQNKSASFKAAENSKGARKAYIAGSIFSGAAQFGAGIIGGKIGGNKVEEAHANANKSLGELQMKHSMENIGAGLAQAGIGLGISSFDAGIGGGMIGAGMSTVEKGAAEYGQEV